MRKWNCVEACLKDLPGLSRGGRDIRLLVLHHTWQPDHRAWRGDASAEGVREYWLQRQRAEGWRVPLGGHFLLAPGGEVSAPFGDIALALNANSDRVANLHGVALEAVGNFDTGHDRLEDVQRHAVIGLLAALCLRFSLSSEAVFFHRDFTRAKTCPGTSLSRDAIRRAVHDALPWAETFR